MKKLILIALVSSVNVFANQSHQLRLQEDLRKVILEKEDITSSDGIISEMNCGAYYDGISCNVEFTFFDERDAYVCNEVYTYRGGEEYWILDSDCWFREL